MAMTTSPVMNREASAQPMRSFELPKRSMEAPNDSELSVYRLAVRNSEASRARPIGLPGRQELLRTARALLGI